ncbi:MAG: right-handed parallel beta-helix repeat-containing protein [Lewinellaceae bacterium]|nr:right-handed parallel beta-helix repeat-containing protein [Lewinellaceae bacterium]
MNRLLLPLLLLLTLPAYTQEIALRAGLVINQSCTVVPGEYRLDAAGEFSPPCTLDSITGLITIQGDNLIVDFRGATLRSSLDPTKPDQFTGLALRVSGKNILIKNARIHGYKVAVLVGNTDNLTLEDCDFSYNYRPRLYSLRERENFTDWLSYHNNEQHEWLRYGAGIYLNHTRNSTIRNCKISGNQNALLMNDCTDNTIYNNNFSFNSGLGVGLYRSNHNRIMHNRLDWNVRGYSHGFYERGQDSAAILAYEQSSNNTFAFNSCTHSGDGFFLWAGQHTMDTGEGGCNDNLIFSNDFSYAPTNGIEVTFSRNTIQGNTIRDCTYGIWGGYSFNSLIMGNAISGCRTAIAIEHGQEDTIKQNLLMYDSTGIRLWARAEQPAVWGYAQKRDVRNRDHVIDRNVIIHVRKPLYISRSENVLVNGENLIGDFQTLLQNPEPNQNLRFWRNEIFCTETQLSRIWDNPELAPQRSLNFPKAEPIPQNPYYPLDMPVGELKEPPSLPDAMLTDLPQGHPRGRKFIIVDQWGPYDFQRPFAYLAPVQPAGNTRTIQLLGPKNGNWRLDKLRNCDPAGSLSGSFPDSLQIEVEPDALDNWSVAFLYEGPDTIVSEFGATQVPTPQQPYPFTLVNFDKKLLWDLSFFNYSAKNDPLQHPDAFAKLLQETPYTKETGVPIYHAWWDSPSKGIQADQFASVATSSFDIAPGKYVLEVSSDDGVRVYLDDRLVLEHWDVHEPAVDAVAVALGGHHSLRIEHFDAGGFSTLDCRIRKSE